jgi:hypothetical protein
MKLFIWKGLDSFLDYYNGVVIAVAENKEEAIQNSLIGDNIPQWLDGSRESIEEELRSKEPMVIEGSCSFTMLGGFIKDVSPSISIERD